MIAGKDVVMLFGKGWAAGLSAFSIMLATSGAWGAEHYIRAGAGGAADGSSWTDAWNDLPDTFVRGDTYYVAAGAYGPHDFTTPESGTTPITIKKATAADHGAAGDWDAAYAAGPATFAVTGCGPGWFGCHSLTFATSYWIWDGATGSGSDLASYGFQIPATTVPDSSQHYLSISAGDVATFEGLVFRHTAITCSGPTDDTAQAAFYSGPQATINGLLMQYVYADNCENSVHLNGADWLIERSYFGRQWSSSSHHGEQIDVGNMTRLTFRYNVVAQCAGTTCLGNYGFDDFDIYGNIFENVATGNGVVGCASAQSITNTRIYQNTIINNHSSLLYQNNPGLGSGHDNVVKNNLCYNSTCGINPNGGGPIDHDYNAFFSVTGAPSETHGQVADGDPFVDSAAGDFHLREHTDPGLDIGAPYDVDADGTARSTWDRGAYELVPTCQSDADCTSPPECHVTTGVTCNGSDVCIYPHAADGTPCAADANPCTADACENGTCVHSPQTTNSCSNADQPTGRPSLDRGCSCGEGHTSSGGVVMGVIFLVGFLRRRARRL